MGWFIDNLLDLSVVMSCVGNDNSKDYNVIKNGHVLGGLDLQIFFSGGPNEPQSVFSTTSPKWCWIPLVLRVSAVGSRSF